MKIDQGDVILEIKGVRKSFDGVAAVRGVDFKVRAGTLHAVIGLNGAGKTTLFNVVTGLLSPDEGQVLFEGHDITGRPPWVLVDEGIGRSFQQTNVFLSMQAVDNVVLAKSAARRVTRRILRSVPKEIETEAKTILQRMGLEGRTDIEGSSLSHGEQRALECSIALAVESRLLLLDEPTAGLGAGETQGVMKLIREVAKEGGLTVLFIEHDMDFVFGIADWVTVLHEGRVFAEGRPEEIRNNRRVQAIYLGEEG